MCSCAQPPYAIRYPDIPNTFNELPCTPAYNQIVGNFACNSTRLFDYDIQKFTGYRNLWAENSNSTSGGCVGGHTRI